MSLGKVTEPMREEIRSVLKEPRKKADELAYYVSDRYAHSEEYIHEVHFAPCNEMIDQLDRLAYNLLEIAKRNEIKFDRKGFEKSLLESGYGHAIDALQKVTNPSMQQKFYRALKEKLMTTEYSESKRKFKLVKNSSNLVHSLFSNVCIKVGIDQKSLNIPTYRDISPHGYRLSYQEYMAGIPLINQNLAEIETSEEDSENIDSDSTEEQDISMKFELGIREMIDEVNKVGTISGKRFKKPFNDYGSNYLNESINQEHYENIKKSYNYFLKIDDKAKISNDSPLISDAQTIADIVEMDRSD